MAATKTVRRYTRLQFIYEQAIIRTYARMLCTWKTHRRSGHRSIYMQIVSFYFAYF